jgi:hypothetical protein
VDNLLVPVCLSATHVAWGAVRLEPVWMMTGEAAGIAAALAGKHHTTPAELNPELLLKTLCGKRHFTTFFNELQADADHPAMPAAQYFGTKGFFTGYDAKLGEPLSEALQTTWLEGFAQLQAGTLDPMRLTQRVRESEAVPSPATTQTRGDFLLQLWKKQNTPQ